MLLLFWHNRLSHLRTSDASYLFTIAGRDGAMYSFGSDGSDTTYETQDGKGRVEYVVKPVGRIIP